MDLDHLQKLLSAAISESSTLGRDGPAYAELLAYLDVAHATQREADIKMLLASNAELTKAVANAPEFLKAVKVATSEEIDQLRAGLAEALEMLTSPKWSPATTVETATRAAELRQLLAPREP